MQAEEEEADEGEQQQKRKGFTTDEESSLVSTPPANAAGTRKRGGARPRGRFILFFLHGRAPNVFPQRACSHTYLHTRTNHLHRRTCTYIHVLTSTHKYLQVLNALARTYKYLQVLTRTYKYLRTCTICLPFVAYQPVHFQCRGKEGITPARLLMIHQRLLHPSDPVFKTACAM